jgi:energy-coupling factor transporter ATP-binding protein EcfA2
MSESNNYHGEDSLPPPPILEAQISDFKYDDDDSFNFAEAEVTPLQEAIDIYELASIIRHGNEDINKFKDKDVVLVIGKTGVGKSTFIQLLHGVEMERTGDTSQPYRAKVGSACLPDFAIGHGKTSQTKILKSYLDSRFTTDLVFCDLPGYKDTESIYIDIAVSVWINRIAKISKSIRLVLMIQMSTLLEARGGNFRELLTLMVKLLDYQPQRNPERISQSILFLFTHMSDPYLEEQSEEQSLEFIHNEVMEIIKGTNKDDIDYKLLNIIADHIKDNSKYVRALNPITTNIEEMINFIRGYYIDDGEYRGLFALDKNVVTCALSNDIQSSVTYSVERLESDIKDALISTLEEKQVKLSEQIQILILFDDILPIPVVHTVYIRVLDAMIAEYEDCVRCISKTIHSNVEESSFYDIIREDDANVIEFKFQKLKLLLTVFQVIKNQEMLSDEIVVKISAIDFTIVSHLQIEFARKCFYHKIDLLERFYCDVDYGNLLEGVKQLQRLSILNSTFEGIYYYYYIITNLLSLSIILFIFN